MDVDLDCRTVAQAAPQSVVEFFDRLLVRRGVVLSFKRGATLEGPFGRTTYSQSRVQDACRFYRPS
jgi:hypothetical protein